MIEEVSVTELTENDAGHGWDEFVERHPQGTMFHLTLWRDLIRRHFPHRPRYLQAFRGARRVGVLPLFETRSILSGRALYSVPYGVYGGPLVHDDEAVTALVAAAQTMVHGEGFRFAELRCQHAPAVSLPTTELYATFVRELPQDPAECLGLIPRKSRATTRQARDRHGLVFVEDPVRVADFHRLFVLNKRGLGSPAFSLAFFEDLLRRAGRKTRLHVVLKDDAVIMGVISFTHGDVFNPYYSGSVPGADRIGTSNFMYWKLMELATAEHFRRFDFGRSRVDTGPYHFKRHMGFEADVLGYRYVLGDGQEVPSINPSNPSFSLPRKVLQSMPYPLIRALGPYLMRMVP